MASKKIKIKLIKTKHTASIKVSTDNPKSSKPKKSKK